MITITGAAGNVGRPLVQALVSAGEQVTAVSRRPDAGAGAGPGVRHQQADLAVPESLKPALDGAAALFLLVAGEEPGRILEIARASGVRRVVLLSTQGAGTRPGAYRHAAAFEAAVRQSGLDATVLRPGGKSASATWARPTGPSRTSPSSGRRTSRSAKTTPQTRNGPTSWSSTGVCSPASYTSSGPTAPPSTSRELSPG